MKKIAMKKLILMTVVLLFSGMALSAQGSRAFEKGYRGTVNIGGEISVTKGWPQNSVGLTTSHGYSFGDGMYLGGGLGFGIDMGGDYASIPVFFDAKYNIVDWKLSPYVDCRVGMELYVDGGECAFMASPGVGFDYRMMSFRVGYKCKAGNGFKLNAVSLSVAVNF